MALCNAMIGLGKALARQFVGELLHPALHRNRVRADGLADMAVERPELDIQRETGTGSGRRTAQLRERWRRLTAVVARLAAVLRAGYRAAGTNVMLSSTRPFSAASKNSRSTPRATSLLG